MDNIVLLLFVTFLTRVAGLEDPLCIAKACPQNTVCRVVKDCGQSTTCTLKADCLENPPKFSHVGVCKIGNPILALTNGTWDDTRCGPGLPCPQGAYCNTDLMDTYATCCRIDPAQPVKKGQCPNVTDSDNLFCVDTCGNDGDCRQDDKCCRYGCRKGCLMPVVENLCDNKACPQNTVCRVVKDCGQSTTCTLKAECLENPPKFSHVGVCKIGNPILALTNGTWDDTRCGPGLPCPQGAYCNTELMDTYATCCRIDPAQPVKKGQCPNVTDSDNVFCVDTCGNDGDCRHDQKCCHHGCRKRCSTPVLEDPCANKACLNGQYCLRPSMPKCQGQGRCWEIGDCVPCPLLRNCEQKCNHGFATDSRGCRVCQCKNVTGRPANGNKESSS